ncbi:MAG: hypothetical protein A2666_02325 [Parcubacteria group bacterium RIFCSPHIGHO2_01_FULL_47_10b]|nr:MAG: hypothetical protein A2666_02325 [Parcubacteria group bacterium RIFCSPHIGHO2_01_FULL_47_10b]
MEKGASIGKITLLGTGTCQLQVERMASSVLIDLPGLRLLFDIGRGVTLRLSQLGIKQNEIENIIISHFHPDHISDLIPYFHAARWSRIDKRTKDIHLFGPRGLQSTMDKIFAVARKEAPPNERFNIDIHEVASESLMIKNYSFDFIHLPPVENHGLRFAFNDKMYAITGDSAFHEQESSFLKNVDLAIVDAGHITDEELVKLSVKSGVKRLVASHLYREIDGVKINRLALKNGYMGKIIIGQDLMEFTI